MLAQRRPPVRGSCQRCVPAWGGGCTGCARTAAVRGRRICCASVQPADRGPAAPTAAPAAAALPVLAQAALPPAHLRDPAHISAAGTSSARVTDVGGALSLDTYMRLPIEQYYCLDPSQISFLGGNRFILRVPRVSLLGTWLEPELVVQVTQEPGVVMLEAQHCTIRGSSLIESLHLAERFELRFNTRLTWAPTGQHPVQAASLVSAPGPGASVAAPGARQQAQGREQGPQQPQARPQARRQDLLSRLSEWGDGMLRRPTPSTPRQQVPAVAQAQPPGPQPQAPQPQLPVTQVQPQHQPGSIQGRAHVDVWCEVVPPFHLMPREVLEGSCNAVLRALVNSLLPLFLRQLADDYGKWASTDSYRALRAARTKPLS